MRDNVLAVAAVTLLFVAIPSWAQSTSERPPERRPGCLPTMISLAAAAPEPTPVVPEGDSCPCFDAEALDALPTRSWDLCVEGTHVAQATSWYGRRTADGSEGFNVLVVSASQRGSESYCQLLHRYLEGSEMKQDYWRIVGISKMQVSSCRTVLADWLRLRGGCATVVGQSR